MARQNLIKHIRSAVQHNIPSTAQLELGEIGLNTYDGKIFIHQTDGVTPSISEISIGEVFQLTNFNGHVHSVSITGQQAYNLIKDGTTIAVRSSTAASHFHDVTISYDAANKTFVADTISEHVGHTFATSGGGLPAQSSNSGKFLSTNGTTTSWQNLPSTLTVKDVSGTNVIADVSEIRFDDGAGFNVTDLTEGAVQVSLGSHWKDLLIEGQTTLSPSGEESLQIVEGNNVVITTDSSSTPKKLIIGVDSGYTEGTTVPASPTTGDEYFDQTTDILYKYVNDGSSSAWIDISTDSVLSIAGIDDLGDVDTNTAAPTNGQVLEWDGTNWVPTDAAAGILQDIATQTVGTSVVVLDTWANTSVSAKYQATCKVGSKYSASEILVLNRGTSAEITEYAALGDSLLTFTVAVNGSNIELSGVSTDASTSVKLTKVLQGV